MASSAAAAPASGASSTIITQTRVLPEHAADFAAWQKEISDGVAAFPGFISDRGAASITASPARLGHHAALYEQRGRTSMARLG